ncbi:hypothetical protein ACEV9E_10610 [Vibrio parahaemolyticus]|uniref:hypothetical protein n=6 Tax=Vibrio parahaemolyticus TaxID=670 RepID=UPI0003ED8FEA|nr:hypothetical protein [Vibrio parahaemolyticus]AHI98212.1 Capsule polysaccharide export protein [Vibrio parahaemolyticus UCM-V493]ALG53108.1 Capsule polysaccharide export protein [Vibrio parahaemolyticus]EGQ7685334.1 hypothetical protein [Vibrio parahaemolyticus]EGQ8184351.1 hypothetical protein [Vibrio parahaemolyticus]EGQ8541752.1 hypothetical protein [Vibrio parahaemolyticus]
MFHDLESPITLYVHIGTGKTGSTTIQSSLLENDLILQQEGVKYLGLMLDKGHSHQFDWQIPGGFSLFMQLEQQEKNNQLVKVLTDECRYWSEHGCNKLVWSHEAIFNSPDAFSPALQALEQLGVKVVPIVYIRNHISWAFSAYKQWGIKHKTYDGQIMTFEEWCNSKSLSFMPYLLPWAERMGGTLKVRNFDKCPSLMDDFNSILELSTKLPESRKNTTPSDSVLSLWASFNNQFDEQVGPGAFYQTLGRLGITEHSNIKGVDYKSCLANEDNVNQLAEMYAHDLEAINYFMDLQGQPLLEHTTKVPTSDLKVEDSMAVMLTMIVALENQVAALRKHIEHLEQRDKK